MEILLNANNFRYKYQTAWNFVRYKKEYQLDRGGLN